MAKVHIAISRPLANPVWRSRSDSIELNQERFEGPTQPLTITFARGGQIEASHRSLPFAGGSVDSIEIEEVLELVRDDRTLFAEITRVLVPGGTLRMRVPNRGAVAGFDSLNLYRYVADVSRAGVRVPEVDEVGFRRHFDLSDLADALGSDFVIDRTWTTGTGISELVHFGALAGLTLTQRSAERYLPVRPALTRLMRADRRVPVPFAGFWRWIEATRIDD